MGLHSVHPPMKTCCLWLIFSLTPLVASPSGREVVRDSSGKIIRTIEHQKQPGGGVRSVSRDASGRLIGTSVTQPSTAGGSRTEHRDSSGRLTGSSQSRASGQTVDRDAAGRLTGTAQTTPTPGSGNRTQFRDASGRLTGTQTESSTSRGAFAGTRRDASGRVVERSSGSGGSVPRLQPHSSAKK